MLELLAGKLRSEGASCVVKMRFCWSCEYFVLVYWYDPIPALKNTVSSILQHYKLQEHRIIKIGGASRYCSRNSDNISQAEAGMLDMCTACIYAGCLTGPKHFGTELHGILACLAKSVVCGTPYWVYGCKAKQARDNRHSAENLARWLTGIKRVLIRSERI